MRLIKLIKRTFQLIIITEIQVDNLEASIGPGDYINFSSNADGTNML